MIDQTIPTLQAKTHPRQLGHVALGTDPAALTNSPAFKNWFGNSKALDDQGQPAVVFHGTNGSFSAFAISRTGTFGSGIYFLDEQADAANYGEQIVSVYLSLQKPWVISVDSESASVYGEDYDHPGIEAILSLPNGRQLLDQAIRRGSAHFERELTDELISLGYDGVIATYPGGSKEYVAFRREQIKSATMNNGQFDPSDPRIEFRLDGQRLDQTLSPAFKRWFMGSKIVGSDRAPLRVFHGTSQDFSEFSSQSPAKVWRLDGSEVQEATYAQMGELGLGSPQSFHPLALSDANHIGVTAAIDLRSHDANQHGYTNGADHQRVIRDLGRLADHNLTVAFEMRGTGAGFYFTPESRYAAIREAREGWQVLPVYVSIANPVYLDAQAIESAALPEVMAKYREMGHDGAIFANNPDDLARNGVGGATQIVAFYPEQIKSALSNIGQFSPDNPNISHRLEDGAGRAPTGGATGINGENYRGGQFLPNTTLPKQSPGARSAPSHKALIAPGVLATCPNPATPNSLFAVFREFMTFDSGKAVPHMRSQVALTHYVDDDPVVAALAVSAACHAFNAGTRWIDATTFKSAIRNRHTTPENETLSPVRAPDLGNIVERAAMTGYVPPMSAQVARDTLQRYFGGGIEQMERVGLLSLVTDASELPGSIQNAIRNTTKSALVSDKQVRQSIIIANRHSDASDLLSSVLHEIGGHYRLPKVLGDRAYNHLLHDLRDRETSDPGVSAMAAEVKAHYPGLLPSGVGFWSEVLARLCERPDQIQAPFLSQAISAFKGWLYRHGMPGISLNNDDIGRIAAASVRATIRDAVAGKIHDAPFSVLPAGDKTPTVLSKSGKDIADTLVKRALASRWKQLLLTLRGDQPVTEMPCKTGIPLLDDAAHDAVFTAQELIDAAPTTEASNQLNALQHLAEMAGDVAQHVVLPREDEIMPSTAFKTFFGDSQVTQASGEPQVVYHGSHEGIAPTEFDTADRMIWASTSPKLAYSYAMSRTEDGPDGAVLPLYMRIERPFNADALGRTTTVADLFGELQRQSPMALDDDAVARLDIMATKLRRHASREESGPYYAPHNFWHEPRLCFGRDGAALIERAMKLCGYDGIQFTETAGRLDQLHTAITYGALNSTQVKSALTNTGNFNPDSPLITERTAPVHALDNEQTAYSGLGL